MDWVLLAQAMCDEEIDDDDLLPHGRACCSRCDRRGSNERCASMGTGSAAVSCL
jgi:hypothetical protein